MRVYALVEILYTSAVGKSSLILQNMPFWQLLCIFCLPLRYPPVR